MKKIISAIVFFICFQTLTAQKKDADKKFALRTMYASLLDPVQSNLTFGAEYNVGKKQSIALDYSFIFHTPSLFNNNDIHSGFIIKPCYKFYTDDKKNDFFEFDLFWKKLNTEQTRWVGKDLQNGIPTYYQKEDYTLVKDVFGLDFKYGIKIDLLDKFIFIEPYIGLGVRTIHRKIAEHPDEIISVKAPFYNEVQTNKTYWGVSFPMGVRLVVAIK